MHGQTWEPLASSFFEYLVKSLVGHVLHPLSECVSGDVFICLFIGIRVPLGKNYGTKYTILYIWIVPRLVWNQSFDTWFMYVCILFIFILSRKHICKPFTFSFCVLIWPFEWGTYYLMERAHTPYTPTICVL